MDKEKKDLLFFGYGLGLIAVIFGVVGMLKQGLHLVQIVFLVCGGVFVGVTIFEWTALRPGYRGWMKVARMIGGVVTTGILAAVFFLVFTPIGLLFRLIGKDHLERKIDLSLKTYWHPRPQGSVGKERYYQQF